MCINNMLPEGIAKFDPLTRKLEQKLGFAQKKQKPFRGSATASVATGTPNAQNKAIAATALGAQVQQQPIVGKL